MMSFNDKRMRYRVNQLKNRSWNRTGNVTVSDSNINFTGPGKITTTLPVVYAPDEFIIDIKTSKPTNRYSPKSFVIINFEYVGGHTFGGVYPIIGEQVLVEPDISEKGDRADNIDLYPIKNFEVSFRSQEPINIHSYSLYKSTKDVVEEKDDGFSQNEDGSYNIGDDISGGGGGAEMDYVKGVPVVLNKFERHSHSEPDNTVDGYVDGYIQVFNHTRRPDFGYPPSNDVPEGEFTDEDFAPPWWITDSKYDNIKNQTPETIKYLYGNDGGVYVSWGDSDKFYATSDYKDPFQVAHGYDGTAARWVLVGDTSFSGRVNREFKFIDHNQQYVEIPHTIRGVEVTSYENMFMHSVVIGVRSSNRNITSTEEMFKGNGSKALNLENFNTSNVVNMRYMFQDTFATSINMSGFDTSKVEDMVGMFASTKATTLNLSNFDTSSVKNMAAMFSNSEATDIDITSFNTPNLTNTFNMFGGSEVRSLDFSNFNTSQVTNMGRMFQVSSVEVIDLKGVGTDKVKSMDRMFLESKGRKIDMGGLNANSVTDMPLMFYRSKATDVNLNGFTTEVVTNTEMMFMESKARRLDLRGFDTFNVKSMASMFRSSEAEEILFSDKFVTAWTDDMSWMFAESKVKELDLSGFSFTHKKYGGSPGAPPVDISFMFNGAEVEVIYVGSVEDAEAIWDKTSLPDHTRVIVK